MSYDLRHESWIPWLRRSELRRSALHGDGRIEWGPPALLTDSIEEDPIVALATPRPDFDGALQEFLIGLLTVALQATDDDAWHARWLSPPSSVELQAAFDALPAAFDLDGDGPRVFQDTSAHDVSKGKTWAIESLLIDTPGTELSKAARREVITSLFVKPGRVQRLGRPAAAMALITLQTYSPEGGRGHRTSLRGGGPLATLVDPRADSEDEWSASDKPLWQKLWANVETRKQWAGRCPGDVSPAISGAFPWLSPTRASDPGRGGSTTPNDVHPLQAYFGMPRRIRLDFGGSGRCDLTGLVDDATVISFVMRAYGTHYQKWKHPLSPHYYDKKESVWRPVHGRAGGVAWNDWLGLVYRRPEGNTREPAAAVAAFHDRAEMIEAHNVRLHAFGYDLASAKAIGWAESVMPLFWFPDGERRTIAVDTARRLIDGTEKAVDALLDEVKHVFFRSRDSVRGDLSQVKSELWSATEQPFYAAIRRLAVSDPSIDAAEDECVVFAKTVESSATAIFDRVCADQGSSPEGMRRLVGARLDLVLTLRGLSKTGESLFTAFRIPFPGGGRAARAATSRKRKEVTT